MRQHRSLQFWGQVRAVNWMLGTAGLVFALFSLLSRHAAEQRRQHDEAARQWEQHQLLNWPGRTISRLAFSPDGRTLVGQGSWIQPGVSLGETRAWDVRTGKRLWTNSHRISAVLPATFLPGGQTLVSVRADYDTTPRTDTPGHVEDYWPSADVRLWLRFRDTRSGRIISDSAPLDWRTPAKPTSIDVSPDGHAIVVAFSYGVAIWDARAKAEENWRPRWMFTPARELEGVGISRPVVEARFMPDSRHLVVLRAMRTDPLAMRLTSVAEVWDARTCARVRSFDESLPLSGQKTSDTDMHIRAALSPDRQRIATLMRPYGTSRISLALWEVKTGKLLRKSDPAMPSGAPGDVPFDSLEFLAWRGGKAVPARPGKGGVSLYGHDVVVLMAADPGMGNVVRNPAFRRYWVPELNRLEQVQPKGAFVPGEDSPVSPNGRLRARPGGRGDARPVLLYEPGV